MITNSLSYIFFFCTGLIFGSFFSVILNRFWDNPKSILNSRSKCPSCKQTLRPKHLIPLFSYIFQKGRCAFCKNKIPLSYLFLELSCAIYLTLIAIHFTYSLPTSNFQLLPLITNPNLILISLIGLNAFLLAAFDLKSKFVPNLFLYLHLILSLLYATISNPNPISILFALILTTFFLGGQILISKGAWLGSADLIFMLGTSIFLGFEKTLLTILLSYILGGAISIPLLLTKKFTPKDSLPFLPFLVFSSLISHFFGNQLILWYIG